VAVVINTNKLYGAISASSIVLIILGFVKGLYAITLLHKLFFPILGHDDDIDEDNSVGIIEGQNGSNNVIISEIVSSSEVDKSPVATL
jgi:hypothetical protein